jgi:hypothetical protein
VFEILFSKPDSYRLVTMRKFGSSSRAILLIETFMGLSSTPLAGPRTLSAIAKLLNRRDRLRRDIKASGAYGQPWQRDPGEVPGVGSGRRR